MVTAPTAITREVALVELLPLEWRRPWYASAAIRRRHEHEFKAWPWTRTGSYGRSLGGRNLGQIL